jgi:hypothetical protein
MVEFFLIVCWYSSCSFHIKYLLGTILAHEVDVQIDNELKSVWWHQTLTFTQQKLHVNYL